MSPEWPPPPPPSYDNALLVPHHLFADEYSYDYVIRTVTPRFIGRFDHERRSVTPADQCLPIDVLQWIDPRPSQAEIETIWAEIAKDYSWHTRTRDGRL